MAQDEFPGEEEEEVPIEQDEFSDEEVPADEVPLEQDEIPGEEEFEDEVPLEQDEFPGEEEDELDLEAIIRELEAELH